MHPVSVQGLRPPVLVWAAGNMLGCVCQDGSGIASGVHPHGLLIVHHRSVRQAAHVQLAHALLRPPYRKAYRTPVITVPQGYAWEICTAEGGWGLHNILQGRQHVLNGITNGIDMDEWDPARDAHTPAPFTAADTSGKAACKAALQAELGFDVDARVRIRILECRVYPKPGSNDVYGSVECRAAGRTGLKCGRQGPLCFGKF